MASQRILAARKRKERVIATHHDEPYPTIQSNTEQDLEHLEWKGLVTRRLGQAWDREEDALYDYL
jgi:hypothetical protein